MPFDPTKTGLVASYEVPGLLYGLSLDERNGKLFAGGAGWSVWALDLNGPGATAVEAWRNHENYVSAMTLLPGDAFDDVLVTASYDRHLNWTLTYDGTLLRRVSAHEGWVRDVAAFPDRERLVSVGDDMLVKVWEAQTGKLVQALAGHATRTPQGYLTALYAVAVSPDGRWIASADRIGEVRVWEADGGRLAHAFRAADFYTYDPQKRVRSIGGIRSLAFSPDGTRLAVAGIGQVTNVDGFVGPCRVELWDWQAEERTFVGRDGHKAVLNKVAFWSPPGEVGGRKSEVGGKGPGNSRSSTDHHPPLLIGAGGGDGGGVIVFWSTQRKQVPTEAKPLHKAKLKGHIQDFALDAAGTRLYAAGAEGIGLWDLTGRDVPANG